MTMKITALIMSVLALLLLVSCTHDYITVATYDEPPDESEEELDTTVKAVEFSYQDLLAVIDVLMDARDCVTGTGNPLWPGWGASIQSGEIKQSGQDWKWLFGELPPGRYMFIRGGSLGDRSPDYDPVYAVVEFVVTADSPVYLP